MRKMQVCRECEIEFNPNSRWKREVKGYINVCPACTEEAGGDPHPEIRGFVTGAGKMQDISFVRFEHEAKLTHIVVLGMRLQAVELSSTAIVLTGS